MAAITPYGHGIRDRAGRSFRKPRSARWMRGMGPLSQNLVMACRRLATTFSPSDAGRPESGRWSKYSRIMICSRLTLH
eukprot:15861371-Heterocapsa_arctica.AAC.1